MSEDGKLMWLAFGKKSHRVSDETSLSIKTGKRG